MHANNSDELGQRCLLAFTQLVPAAVGAFYRIDERLDACDFQLHRMRTDMHDSYLAHYRHLDPLQPRRCVATGLPVVPLQLGMARQDRRETRQYQGFLQQHGMIDVVEIIASANGRPLAGLSLLRSAEQGHFSPHELSNLQALQGLLEMAARALPLPAANPALALLTPREREIALLLREGISNKLLARELGVGLPTVKTHLINLFRKLGVSSRTELVGALFL